MQQFIYDDILKKAKKAEGKPEMEQKIKNEAVGSLTAEQKQRLENVLNDPDALQRLLSSKRAQDIIKKLGK